mgnify:FL=1
MAKEKLISYVKKYRYVALVVLAGVVLMLLPSGKGEQQTSSDQPVNVSEAYSLAETEKRLEQLLGRIRGVGQVQVMLTLKSGSSLQLAENRSTSLRDTEDRQDRDVVTLNRGSGYEDVVVTEQTYPVYQGAVVVCQGAGDSSVNLAVIQAVSVLTGLGSDKITVVQWK